MRGAAKGRPVDDGEQMVWMSRWRTGRDGEDGEGVQRHGGVKVLRYIWS